VLLDSTQEGAEKGKAYSAKLLEKRVARGQMKPEAAQALLALPEVVEMHATTGDADVLAKVVARDTVHLHKVTTAMLQIPGVHRSSTAISLAEHLPTRLRPLLVRAAQGG